MIITPHKYYLLCRLDIVKPTSKIIRPETAEQGLTYGVVLAAGPECKTTKVGDKVLFQPGNMIGMEEKKQTVIIPEGAVFATLELEDENEL